MPTPVLECGQIRHWIATGVNGELGRLGLVKLAQLSKAFALSIYGTFVIIRKGIYIANRGINPRSGGFCLVQVASVWCGYGVKRHC